MCYINPEREMEREREIQNREVYRQKNKAFS